MGINEVPWHTILQETLYIPIVNPSISAGLVILNLHIYGVKAQDFYEINYLAMIKSNL